MRRFAALIALAALATVASCKRNPIERLTNPIADGAVPGISGVYVLYDDELKTGGGVSFIPGGENQAVDFADKSSPRRTANQVRYNWNGQDVFNGEALPPGFQHLFAGFSLVVPIDGAQVPVITGKDLSVFGYTKMTFWVRGDLSSDNRLRVEGPSSAAVGFTPARVELSASELASGWRQVTLTVPPIDFANVKVYATVSIQYDQPPRTTANGAGGTIYLDDIQYEQ